jgi:hypothetical protein
MKKTIFVYTMFVLCIFITIIVTLVLAKEPVSELSE